MKKNNQNKFYAVAGVNGRGVYDDYDEVMNSRKYIASFKCKRLKGFDEAKSYAEDMYWDLQGDNFFDYSVPEIKRVNYFYYRKKIVD